MAKITISTKNGVVMEQVDTHEYNLDKSIGRASLLDELLHWVKLADDYAKGETKRQQKGE